MSTTLEERFDAVASEIVIGDRKLDILHPRNPDDLISEKDFVMDERLPYWADIWPSSIILATYLSERKAPRKAKTLELGCGVGLVTTVAMMSGYDMLASDYYEDALEFTRANSLENAGAAAETRMINWRHFPSDVRGFDHVLASDVLYEVEYAKILPSILEAALVPGGTALIADPGRVAAPEFIAGCERVNLRLEKTETFPFAAGKIQQQITIYTLGR